MIDHDILGFDITMHNSNGVSVVQSLQNLIEIELAVIRSQNL